MPKPADHTETSSLLADLDTNYPAKDYANETNAQTKLEDECVQKKIMGHFIGLSALSILAFWQIYS